MYRVIKRDNSIVDFNLTKIKDAMSLAFQSRQKPCHPDVLDLLALKVTADFSSKVKDELVNVEDIQDSVESVLIQAGYADVAKAYILYRRQRDASTSASKPANFNAPKYCLGPLQLGIPPILRCSVA